MLHPDSPANEDKASVDDFKYWAFISYSHQDKAWGRWLHKALETYRVPKRLAGHESRDGVVPRRLFPVFRDREELSTSSDLSLTINAALVASRYLIVIASPDSAAWKWVNEEVRAFKTMGREDRVLCLIVAGEPNATDNTGSGLHECFPEAVRFRVDASGILTSQRAEPIAADVRPGKDGKRNARLKVIAGLLGVGYDELKQREQHRQLRFLIGVASTLLAVAISMAVLAYFAVEQRKVAEFSEREAVHQRAKALIEQGHALNMANRWLRGFEVLEEGRNILQQLSEPTLQADLRILEADLKTLVPYRYLRFIEVSGMDLSRDGELLAVSSARHVYIINLAMDQPVTDFDVDGDIDFITMSQDGSRIAIAISKELRIYDTRTGSLLHTANLQSADMMAAEFVPGTEAIFIAATDGGVHVWDVPTSKIAKIYDRDVKIITFDLSENGKVLATAWTDEITEVCRLSNQGCSDKLRIQTGKLESLALTQDGKWLIATDGSLLRVWDTQTGSLLRESSAAAHQLKVIGEVLLYTDLEQNSVSTYDITTGVSLGSFISPQGVLSKLHAVFSVNRMALLTTSDDGVLYWQLTFDRAPGSGASILLSEGEKTNAVSLSANGMLTALADSEGNVRIFDTIDLKELLTFKAHEGETQDIAFARNSEAVATVGMDGYAIVWKLDSQKETFRYAVRGGKPTSVALNNDETLVAVGTEAGEVEVINLETQTPVTEPLQVGNRVTSLAFGPSRDKLAIASVGADVHIWSRNTTSLQKFAHFDFQGYPLVRFGTSGSLLVVAKRAFLYESTDSRQSRALGPVSSTFADAGFLGAEFVYLVHMVENRGVSIVSVDTGREEAYLSPRDTMPFAASANAKGNVLAIAGLDGIMSFASAYAVERMGLRRRMSSTDVTVNEASKGERAKLLAAWYLAHGAYAHAQRYLQTSNFIEHSLPGLAMSRLWNAAGQWDKARESLKRALGRKEVTPTYFALATSAIDAQASANAPSESNAAPVTPH